MKTNRIIMSIGIILLISGILAAFMSYEPSRILQYIFVVTSLTVGVLGILTGKNTQRGFLRSTYYSWIGFVSISLAVALAVWATDLTSFINVAGFFLIVIGVIEFVFVLQILTYETPIPWKILGVKLAVSALTATGAVWVLTTAVYNVYSALLFLGVLFALSGLSIIHISRLTKNAGLTAPHSF